MWVKIALLLLGLAGLGGGVAWYGLPPKAPDKAPAQQAAPAAPQAPQQSAAPATSASPPANASNPAASASLSPQQKPADTAPAAPSAASQPDISPPTFDVVRVEPNGDSVIAGRAAPGAKVTLLLNGAAHATVVADAAGHFAMVAPPLPPGSHELTLSFAAPGGATIVSSQSIAVSVPPSTGGEVIVALVEPGKPTQLLAKPSTVAAAPAAPLVAARAPAPATATPAGERTKVVLSTVEAEDGGKFFASGVAAPGATIRLYLNESFLAAATASPQGGWSFTIGRGLSAGSYRVRVDDVEPAGGKVLSRAEVAFDFAPKLAAAPPSAIAPTAGSAARPGSGPQIASTSPAAPPSSDVTVAEIRSTLVTRGDSLWRISKRVYGKGLRFTVIYEANQQQIRDPRRIYPGQVFVLPTEKQM